METQKKQKELGAKDKRIGNTPLGPLSTEVGQMTSSKGEDNRDGRNRG